MSITDQEFYKPSGTLGYHQFYKTELANGNIEVWGHPTNGEPKMITVKPGDTMGYDCGEVWIVPRPESYKDPIRRIIASEKLPQKCLIFTDQFVISKRYDNYPEGSCADPSHGEEITTFSSDWKKVDHEHIDYDQFLDTTDSYCGGTYAIISRIVRRGVSSYHERVINRIIVNPVKKVEAFNFIKNYFDEKKAKLIKEAQEAEELQRKNIFKKMIDYEQNLLEIAQKAQELLSAGDVYVERAEFYPFYQHIKSKGTPVFLVYHHDYYCWSYDKEDQQITLENPARGLEMMIKRYQDFILAKIERPGEDLVDYFRFKKMS